jgi:hypothetical protein
MDEEEVFRKTLDEDVENTLGLGEGEGLGLAEVEGEEGKTVGIGEGYDVIRTLLCDLEDEVLDKALLEEDRFEEFD